MNHATGARVAWVEDRVRTQCFGAGIPASGATITVGAELELLAFDEKSHAVASIFDAGGSLDCVRLVARRLSWHEALSAKGVPRFMTVTGGSLTFEPGGQLEYASAVHGSVDGVLLELCAVESALRNAADEFGISLLACGVDPYNPVANVDLQLVADRYQKMARYFDAIGPDGARMMRQTASFQINVGGIPSMERWAVANAIAPWLLALFANSTRYAAADTGYASYRGEAWRGVDPSRTGLFAGDDPVREYAAFALGANAFLADDAAPAFNRLDDSRVSDASLTAHLSTLFPEVRPRGYLELRSIDAIGSEARAAALVLVAGILADPTAARQALELTGPADSDLLRRAGRDGPRDARITSTSSDLVRIAREGCVRLGPDVVSEATLSAARLISLKPPGASVTRVDTAPEFHQNRTTACR